MMVYPPDFNPHSRSGLPNKKRFISVSGKWAEENYSVCRVCHREKREESASIVFATDSNGDRYLRKRYSSQLGDRDE